MATQCDDDDRDEVVSTEFFIVNNSSVNLTYTNYMDEVLTIESNSSEYIGLSLNSDSSVPPSANTDLPNIVLFANDDQGELVQVYVQDPIDDGLWQQETQNNFLTHYELEITDEILE